MNASTETATEKTGTVTAKTLLAFLKEGFDSLYTHGHAVPDRPSWSNAFIFELSVKRKQKDSKVEVISKMDIPGSVCNGHTSVRETRVAEFGPNYMRYTDTYRPETGFWSLSYGPAEHLCTILELLPSDAAISFEVALDHGTSEVLVGADVNLPSYSEKGLHSDHFYLNATFTKRGKEKRVSFLLDTQVGAHNTARFGNPGSRF